MRADDNHMHIIQYDRLFVRSQSCFYRGRHLHIWLTNEREKGEEGREWKDDYILAHIVRICRE